MDANGCNSKLENTLGLAMKQELIWHANFIQM